MSSGHRRWLDAVHIWPVLKALTCICELCSQAVTSGGVSGSMVWFHSQNHTRGPYNHGHPIFVFSLVLWAQRWKIIAMIKHYKKQHTRTLKSRHREIIKSGPIPVTHQSSAEIVGWPKNPWLRTSCYNRCQRIWDIFWSKPRTGFKSPQKNLNEFWN